MKETFQFTDIPFTYNGGDVLVSGSGTITVSDKKSLTEPPDEDVFEWDELDIYDTSGMLLYCLQDPVVGQYDSEFDEDRLKDIAIEHRTFVK